MEGIKICGVDFDTNDKWVHSPESLDIILDKHRTQAKRVAQVFYEHPNYYYAAYYVHEVVLPHTLGRTITRVLAVTTSTLMVSVKTKVWGWNEKTEKRVHTWRLRRYTDIIRELVDYEPTDKNDEAGLLIGHIVNGRPKFYDYAPDKYIKAACARLGLPYYNQYPIIRKQAQEIAAAAGNSPQAKLERRIKGM